jgi:hypothetical protein
MSDKLGKPRFDFDFEPFDTGLYTLKVKEVDIAKVDLTEEQEAARKGPKNDFNFVIQFLAEGGEMDGRIHFERFPHIAQGHIGLQKLQACMIKMGEDVLRPSPDPAGHDVSLFDTEDFKKRFKMKVPGRQVVVIIKRTISKRTGGEFSNIVSFYGINELSQAKEDFAKKFKKGVLGTSQPKEEAALPGMDTTGPPAVTHSDW